MKIKRLAPILVFAFVLTAVFGLYLPSMEHVGHEGCPFAAPVSAAVCAAPLAHLGHWQSSFTAVLSELFVLAAAVFFLVAWFGFTARQDAQFVRYRLRKRMPRRPTLFQELFARGILNRKEPQACF